MSDYHESWEKLPEEARNLHRALESLKEEVEAVDWYNQRVALTEDESLKAVLAHNRDEEIEHAMMLLEWLRRNFPGFDERMRTYLFTSAPITQLEELATEGQGSAESSGPPGADAAAGSLNIGSMKEGE